MNLHFFKTVFAVALVAGAGCFFGCSSEKAPEVENNTLVNVSYDPTREFYSNYNHIFMKHWKEATGKDVKITQFHGGSGKQALEVVNGLEADVVTLALEYDVNIVRDAGLIENGWVKEFPRNSAPYTSTIVFLVRKGNPKKIKDWNDLVKDKKLYQNVLDLASGARGSTNTFIEERKGDVLLSWENEAFLSLKDYPKDYEIVMPSVSVLAEPSVAIVDKIVDKRNTRKLATEYLNYLYSDEAQHVAAKHHYRPTNKAILDEYKEFDQNVNLITIEHFGGWENAQKTHFSEYGIFDQIYEKN